MRTHISLYCWLLPGVLNAFRLPFLDIELDLFAAGSTDSVSSVVYPHKIAIIGAGAAGTSAAFWISKAKERSGVLVETDVYERENYIGGRSTVVHPHNDTSFYPLELGASIFVKANKNLQRASQHFHLNLTGFEKGGGLDIWDGEKLRFSMSGAEGVYGWWDSIKALWRYGYKSPYKVQSLVDAAVNKYVSLYAHDSVRWENMSQLVGGLKFAETLAQSAAEYLDLQDVHRLYSREIVEAATRVNYAQNLDEITAMGGLISMAATGASGVAKGNYHIFTNFLKDSRANFIPETAVTSLSKLANNTWALYISDSDSPAGIYNDVIIAAPFHQSQINIEPSSVASSIPLQDYVHLHVTLLSTTATSPNPAYFGAQNVFPEGAILTTYEGVRQGGVEPEFFSLSYHGPIAEGREEWAYKIFSKEVISDEWLNKMFDNQVTWVYHKEWNSYPKLKPINTFAPIMLDSGLYYVNAFEPFISTMETETVASRNVVDLLFRDRFGTGICGGQKSPASNDTISENPNQAVLEEVISSADKDNFVLGFDC